jgi:hypothetical protein
MAEHEGRPWDCPVCAPLIEATRQANDAWSQACTWGSPTHRGKRRQAIYMAAAQARRALIAARTEHAKAEVTDAQA